MAREAPKRVRQEKNRRFKRRYNLICEGAVTERTYFDCLKSFYSQSIIWFFVDKRKASKSSPDDLIASAKKLKRKDHFDGDEVWIILDKDDWTDKHFDALRRWEKEKDYHYLAISSPKFEYWILLHKDDPHHLTRQEADVKFKQWMGPGKEIDCKLLNRDNVCAAAERAKLKHGSNTDAMPDSCGSTIFRLIHNVEDFMREVSSG